MWFWFGHVPLHAGFLSEKHGLNWLPSEQAPVGQLRSINLGGPFHCRAAWPVGRFRLPGCVWRGAVPPCSLLGGPVFSPLGWDISCANLADAMQRAEVLDWSLQQQLRPFMEGLKPRPGIYSPEFIAANQEKRADNILMGTKAEQVGAADAQG